MTTVERVKLERRVKKEVIVFKKKTDKWYGYEVEFCNTDILAVKNQI